MKTEKFISETQFSLKKLISQHLSLNRCLILYYSENLVAETLLKEICLNYVNLKIKRKFFLSMQVFHMMLIMKYFLEINCGKDVKKDF